MTQITEYGERALRAWKMDRPKMVKQLTKTGVLQDALINAQERTKETLERLLREGVPFHLAEERVLMQWILLPPETKVPLRNRQLAAS